MSQRNALHHASAPLRLSMLAIVVLLTAATSTSQAQTADATAKAKQLYDDAVTNYNLGHYDEALASFEKAYRLRHDPIFLFNLGQCQRQLRRYEDAERSYRAYLRESTDVPPATRAQVEKLITEMDNAVAEERAKQPPPGPMAPAEAQPKVTASSTPPPQAGSATRADLVAQAAPRRQEKPIYKRAWFWGVVAGAVVVVGVGVGVGVALGTAKSSTPFPAVQF